MKDKFMQFVKDHRAAIGWTTYYVGIIAVTAYGCALIYHQGQVNGINKLLLEGSLKWTDGMPVIHNGELISGDLNWSPAQSCHPSVTRTMI